MLNLNEFSHNHHPSRVNLLAKYIRRGFPVQPLHPESLRFPVEEETGVGAFYAKD